MHYLHRRRGVWMADKRRASGAPTGAQLGTTWQLYPTRGGEWLSARVSVGSLPGARHAPAIRVAPRKV